MLALVQVPPVPPVPPTPMPDIPGMHDIIVQGPGFFPPPWVTLPPAVIVLITVACCTAAAVVLYPLFRAIARRIEGRVVDPALQQEVEELRERVRDLEAGQVRVAELEERLDFAERLLAQRPQAEQLPRN